jgi:hypothetical protein
MHLLQSCMPLSLLAKRRTAPAIEQQHAVLAQFRTTAATPRTASLTLTPNANASNPPQRSSRHEFHHNRRRVGHSSRQLLRQHRLHYRRQRGLPKDRRLWWWWLGGGGSGANGAGRTWGLQLPCMPLGCSCRLRQTQQRRSSCRGRRGQSSSSSGRRRQPRCCQLLLKSQLLLHRRCLGHDSSSGNWFAAGPRRSQARVAVVWQHNSVHLNQVWVPQLA